MQIWAGKIDLISSEKAAGFSPGCEERTRIVAAASRLNLTIRIE
jgi:hypothetical protein